MEYIYDNPTAAPQSSEHWQSLVHEEGDRCVETLTQLLELLTLEDSDNNNNEEISLSLWSALLGYCEALCTSPLEQKRYNPYPIPIDALRRLVQDEFTPPTALVNNDAANNNEQQHRRAANQVSNWVWSKVTPKANAKDEMHANSLYTVLRGRQLDRKSVDCFGAALVTVIALREQCGYTSSVLTLSEDHAYESHDDGNGQILTCEVAIPGHTLAQQQKRGQEIAGTFQSRNSTLTPETSWLYMLGNAVRCDSPGKLLAAMAANLNGLIETRAQNYERHSLPLLLIKRELLWRLKDGGHLNEFPFALCELGWAEEHATSSRGEARVSVATATQAAQQAQAEAQPPVTQAMTTMEALYHEAVAISQSMYHDKQVYPYCYLGFFHKDGGQEEEYRLGLALHSFAQAARVASTYRYEAGDTLQLSTKVFGKISEFVVCEILSKPQQPQPAQPRVWHHWANAVACAKGLIAFFDFLLYWEEQSGSSSFVPICSSRHKTGLAKAFSLLALDVRIEAFQELEDVKSQRMKDGSLLRTTLLSKPKVALSDMHLTILTTTTTTSATSDNDNDAKRSSSRRKRIKTASTM